MSDSLLPHRTVAYQAPQSMEFSRQEYWSGLPFPSPGDLPNPGIESRSPSLQADALPSEPQGKPDVTITRPQNVTFFGNRVFAGQDWGRAHWIRWDVLNPKDRQGHTALQRRRQCEYGGRDWSDEPLEAGGSSEGFSPYREHGPARPLMSDFLVSGTVRETASVVLRHQVFVW